MKKLTMPVSKVVGSLLWACSCFTFNNVLHSQANNSLVPKINIPTSPEAALISRFGEIPVGYYTGTANISIPFYTIKEGNTEIPITLSYHSSGIKVEDQATWVGLGWDLSPEGTIIQEVRGKRDEFDNNLHNNMGSPSASYINFKNRINSPSPAGVNRTVGQVGYEFYDFCQSFDCDMVIVPKYTTDDASEIVGSLLQTHGQPDIYHFNFNGKTGKFYINPDTHEIVQMDKTEQIYFEKNGPDNISATTLDGTKYIFSTVETAYELGLYQYSDKAGKTFKLSAIQFLNGRMITFTYADAHFTDFNYSQSATIYDLTGDLTSPIALNTRQSDIKILSKITTTDAIIDFNLENREDIVPNPGNVNNLKRLRSIDIASVLSNKKIKSFEFAYSYFPYDLTGVYSNNGTLPSIVTNYEAALGKRLKLDAVKEIGYDNNEVPVSVIPPHVFEYDLSNTMPLKISFAKDFWGYYNGETNQQLLPELTYFDYPNVFKANTNNVPFVYSYQGNNRYPNNLKAGAYMLKKITYPTGGYTEFGYESNSFTNQFIPDKSKAVFKSSDVQDNSILSNGFSQFKLSKTTTIHFENRINNGAANYNHITPLTMAQMAGCYIRFWKFKFVNGSPQVTVIKQWDLSTVLNVDFENNDGKLWSEDIRVEFDPSPDPYLVYHVDVVYPDELNNTGFASIAGVSAHFTYYDDTNVDISESNAAGMRIKTIKSYSQPSVLASNKLIKYYGGKLMSRFSPIEMLSSRYYFECNEIFGSCPQLVQHGPYNKLSISSDGLVKEGGNLVGYDKVEEIELANDNITTNGKKEFSYLNFANIVDEGFPVIVNPRNGLINHEYIYNILGEKLTDKNYSYQNLLSGINCFYSIVIDLNFYGGKDPKERADPGSRHKYSYNAAPLLSEWTKLQGTVTKQYFNGVTLTTSENYTYNQEGSISTVSTVNSKNETLLTKYYYPIDNMVNPYVDNYMTYVHNTGTPVITETYNGSQLLTRQRTVYGNVPSAPTLLPQSIHTQVKSFAEEKKIAIDSYDDRGNITQYTQADNIPVSFVWNSDKTVPIAKIENATYASLLALPGGLSANFRTSLPNARVTTYTYKPLVGVTSITDPNNITTYYEYDSQGRLSLVRDKDHNVIRKICYNYAGQAETCL